MQIKKNILSGNYLTPQTFDADVNLLLDNNKRTCESSSWERNAISSLEEIYEKLKADCLDQLKDVLGFDVDENFVKSGSKNESKPNLNTVLVGSYDPDDDTGVWETKADLHNPEDDKVRCVCGIFEEDGKNTVIFLIRKFYTTYFLCRNDGSVRQMPLLGSRRLRRRTRRIERRI